MESQVEEAADDKDLTCPSCGHLNPPGLTRCERCTGPLIAPEGHYYVDPNQRPDRPGCVTAAASLLIIFGCLYVPVACYGTVDMLSTPLPIWPPAPFIFFGLVAIPLAIMPWTLGAGLWQQKSWARMTVIGLFGVSILFSFFYLVFTLLGFVTEVSKLSTLGASLAVLVIQGYIIHWFAKNGSFFE